MGRIKKVATERHTATASPFVIDFVQQTTSSPLYQLPSSLKSFPQHWPFPRGDLYHWIPLLDRFDHIIELFNKEYGLTKGPQQQPFECRLLKNGDGKEGTPYPTKGAQQADLDGSSYSREGDRELVEAVVHFTRILLEHCGNRSLYASSGNLDDLLNTTSISLVRKVLRLSLRLAQRFHVARYKNNMPSAIPILLASHYNLKLDRLHKIAQPFPKAIQTVITVGSVQSKGKEKVPSTTAYNPCDLIAIGKDQKLRIGRSDLAGVSFSYYDQVAVSNSDPSQQSSEVIPATPTPVRRTSVLGPSRDRPSMAERSATTEEAALVRSKSKESDASTSSAPKSYLISASKVANTPSWSLMREGLAVVPADSSYELLNRVRIGKAFADPTESLQELLQVRLLAVANLAYAVGETKFQEKIGLPDSEEPKRFQLAQQLSALLQPATSTQTALSPETETVVLLTIEAVSKLRHKSQEISDALQISHNHGVIYYELRKVTAALDVNIGDESDGELRETEWQEATFDLITALLQQSTQSRHGERMIGAGILGILVEGLTFRNSRARRFQEKILSFFDSFVHGVPAAFQALADVKGFDIIADLLSYEVTDSLKNAKDGQGLPAKYKSKVVDYDLPFHQQSTLRQLLKFIVHMFEHNAGNNDRLLRNLIDTPQVLGALRNVIENANVCGSNVWSGAVNVMSSFIHNEPTSFQVVAEAGLVKSLLQSIVPWDIQEVEGDIKPVTEPAALEYKDGELQYPSIAGILPVGETMCDVPTAFGAICLNESGMKLFQSSNALLKFMDVFVSPPHVRALEEEGQTAVTIGQAFDELCRHHPQLKEQIMSTIISMVKRVNEVCRYLSEHKGNGAKLWERTPFGISVSGGRDALAGTSQGTSSGSKPVSVTDLAENEKERVAAVPFISACFKFFEGFFHNISMCSLFCESGGAVSLLELATSASNPHDIVAFPVFSKIAQVVKSMCDAKPHLVLPSLIRQTQDAIAGLKPLVDSKHSEGVFTTFLDLSKPQISALPGSSNGTTIAKSLTMMHMLTHVLGRAMSPPQYTGRHSHQANQIFTAVNFTDVYIDLVDNLSQLHIACVRETLALEKSLPEKWKQQTEPRPFIMRRVDANGVVEIAAESRLESQSNGEDDDDGPKTPASQDQEEVFAIKNAKTVRYLLSQAPMGIEAFFHSLSQALVPKRTGDETVKLHASVAADHLAKALVNEIDHKKFEEAEELMWLKALRQAVLLLSRTLLKSSHSMESWGSKEALTLSLNKFYLAGGFDKLNECLDCCCDALITQPDKADPVNQATRDVLGPILNFYNQIARSKTINEAAQSAIISVKEISRPDYFMPGQFVVEIRNAILPAMTNLWRSTALEGASDSHVKLVIETLRIILKAEGEDKAIKRSQLATRYVHANGPEYKLKSEEGLRTLQSSGYSEDLAREALYRCNNNESNAQQYCHVRTTHPAAPPFPISGQSTVQGAPASEQGSINTGDDASAISGPSDLQETRSIEMTDAQTAPEEADLATGSGLLSQADFDLALNGHQFTMPPDLQEQDLRAMNAGSARPRDMLSSRNGSASLGPSTLATKNTHQMFSTVEDLDEKRDALRTDLLDRCLEILSAQPSVTFELSELIQAAVSKTGEGANPRADIGSTLVSSLLSLQAEEPGPESGAKISAYAHLLGLIIQDRDFFDSTLDELKEYFEQLVSWVRLEQDQKIEDAPWIEMILLIIERILVEDEQPIEIKWEAPSAENPLQHMPEPKLPDPVVSFELRSTLFDTVVDLLLKVGKKPSLALSVSRILVILTRRRELAARFREKQNMTKLFVMIRQLGGSVNERLRSSFMIILRHLVEDEQILRQIMEVEIRAAFETPRSTRPMDTTTYSRNLYHLVLRDPNIFIDATKEIVEIVSYNGHPTRGQTLAMKKPVTPLPSTTQIETTNGEGAVQASIEAEAEAIAVGSQHTDDQQPTRVEATHGVIQFLLRELSNYKDVRDEPPTVAKDTPSVKVTGGVAGDVSMTDVINGDSTPAAAEVNRSDKPTTFKPEEHIVYIYRCFLMQCLSELLASYNRTKMEFINFSRKADAQAATPSKPRSGTLNYLLNVLIPVGTLEHRDDIGHRKKLSTSHWATTVLVALCNKTTERPLTRAAAWFDAETDDADLSFVRKFVLDNALRAFRDATHSSEPLDQRYSRLLAIGELFNRMLVNNKSSAGASGASDFGTSQSIGKLMYEKHFVGALTSAIAEIDLNFPNAKRAVKYMLGPLKLLTETGVRLSQTSELSSSVPGTSDEQEIESATSVSTNEEEEDEDREQTPDLYRNSTLGMFDSRGEREDDESGSQSGDEDEEGVYANEYDDEDGMDYEDGQLPDHDEVVSDEDEDFGDMGDMEGVPGDVDFEMDVVINGDDEEVETMSQSSSDDEDDEDEGEDPDQDFVEDMDEINGDDENASMPDHATNEDWEDEDDDISDGVDGRGGTHGGALQLIGDIVAGNLDPDTGEVVRIDMGDGDEEYLEDELAPGEDEDVDDEMDYENDVVYEQGPEEADDDDEDDDDEDEELRWDIGVPPPPQTLRGHHHHHHHRHGLQEVDMFGVVRGPMWRPHRPFPNSRGEDEGINPLLQREGNSSPLGDREYWGNPPMPNPMARRAVFTRQGETLQDLVATMGSGNTMTVDIGGTRIVGVPPMMLQGRNGMHPQIDIDPARPWREQMRHPRWSDMLPPPVAHDSRTPPGEEAQAVEFRPVPTPIRWQEEARLLFGGKHHEKSTRILNTLLKILVPPAMEAKRQSEAAETERKAAEAKAREEELARAETEKAEREARETQEREQLEAREAEAAEAREGGDTTATSNEIDMDGTEHAQPPATAQEMEPPSSASEEPASAAPILTTVRGRELDITSLGIDLAYLNELPEELREEVIMGQFANQRTQAVEAGEQPSEISREFLEALPPEIQRELLRQEAHDRRNREREESRRNAAQQANAQAAQPEEMNNADFMAMLDTDLRQAILLDADDSVLAALPENIQAEARQLDGRRLPRPEQLARLGRLSTVDSRRLRDERHEQAARDASRQRRPVAQMLDRAGIATLLRLMFVSLHHKAKTNLHSVLSSVCKNAQNRAEVIHTLLSILQDGTADVAAVERSFTNLSLRAKQLSGPKTPTPIKRTATGSIVTPGAELSPLNIVQQCLGTLNALTMDNNQKVPDFFLSEHEGAVSQKLKTNKKGKDRDTKAAAYPLNSLLVLLDRKLITDNTGVMEALASLLSSITKPLIARSKKAKEAESLEESREQQQSTGTQTTDVQMAEAAAMEPNETLSVPAESSAAETITGGITDAVNDATSEQAKEPSANDKKKQRDLTPPHVPDENLRLVVNIITARECPAKTFTETLDVIKNLSLIPGAKEVFGKELVRQAQVLSEAVLNDLEDLTKQIGAASTDADLQGMALANFSSANSQQHMLLRVIVALDYLFDAKQASTLPSGSSPTTLDPKLKGDILAGLYESSTFDRLWGNLGQCLTAIRERGNMINIATILLPMIESLLVVCRNSTLKEAMLETASPQVPSGTPPPESRLDTLFFKFTEDHRKILNELIRSNPKLMNGNMSVLANNSKVLEFDNKRSYFTRKVHIRPPQETRMPSLQLSVRRDQVFLDSFKSLYYKSGKEIKYGKLNIRFHGEEGIDAGGVSREWFAAMARQMFNPDYALFNPVASDRTTFHPNPLSGVNEQHLMYFKFIGRIIGKALYEGRVLDCHFSRAVYRRILGRTVSLKDMESLDLDYYKSLVWILENDITDITFETFSVDVDRFGAVETVDLIPDGRNIPVTEVNKHDYVRLVVQHRLITSVEEQLENFLAGFHEIIPPELIAIFNEQELELLISGLPEIDIDDWKNNTEYHNYQPTSPQIQWFWRAVRSFDKEEKAKLLQFVTGTSKVPLNGFKELEGMNGFAKFNIHRDYSSKEKLPSSHTCFNQLDLPEYDSYEHLRQQVYTAITAGSEYFGFA